MDVWLKFISIRPLERSRLQPCPTGNGGRLGTTIFVDCLHWHFRDSLWWSAWESMRSWLQTSRCQITYILHCSAWWHTRWSFVSVPKDLTKVKNKIIFNLTKRQLICFGIAAAVGVPFYFLTRGIIGSSNAATGMCLLMLPAFLFAMYEKDGLPLEKVLKNMITVKFIRPPVRKYQMENLYEKKFIMVRKKKGGQKSVKKKKR